MTPPPPQKKKKICASNKDSDQPEHSLSLISLQCQHEGTMNPYVSIKSTAKPRPRGYKTFFMLDSIEHEISMLIKTKIPTNEEVSCFKFLKCIYHANKRLLAF